MLSSTCCFPGHPDTCTRWGEARARITPSTSRSHLDPDPGRTAPPLTALSCQPLMPSAHRWVSCCSKTICCCCCSSGPLLPPVDCCLLPAAVQLILVSSGFDASAFDPLSAMMLSSEDFRSVTLGCQGGRPFLSDVVVVKPCLLFSALGLPVPTAALSLLLLFDRYMTQRTAEAADRHCGGRLLCLHEGGRQTKRAWVDGSKNFWPASNIHVAIRYTWTSFLHSCRITHTFSL